MATKTTQQTTSMQAALLATRNVFRGQLEVFGLALGMAVESDLGLRFKGVDVHEKFQITFDAPKSDTESDEIDLDKEKEAKKEELITFINDFAPFLRSTGYYVATWSSSWTVEIGIL